MDFLQTVQRLAERVVVLGEMETDQVVDGFPEEAGARHRADADLPGQVFAELEIGFIAVLADVQQNVIGALRLVVDDLKVVQAL